MVKETYMDILPVPTSVTESLDPQNALPQVVLLGRPNVGKSTLFNRLLGKRHAVVADIAGTTRDRIKSVKKFASHQALLVDMAGIEPVLSDRTVLHEGIQRQVETALKEASVVVWVVDGQDGVTADDEKVAEILRRLRVPVVIAVNKCDHANHEMLQYEFSRYGYQSVVAISALHAKGIVQLEQAVGSELQSLDKVLTKKERQKLEAPELALAILGRPNVGKSTLLNYLTGQERAVVSPVSGTTRDAVDTVIPPSRLFGRTPVPFGAVRLVDTAGIRRSGKIGHAVEAWSVLRSLDSLDRADVVLFLIDATESLTHQDLVVAEKIIHAGRPLVIVVNKWDIYLQQRHLTEQTEEATDAQERFQSDLLRKARMLAWSQLIFISAQTGLHVQYLGSLILRSYKAWSELPSQDKVNELVVHLKTLPRLRTLKRIEVQRAKPPVFILHVESSELLHFTTRRMVERSLREWLQLGPAPIKLWVERSREKRNNKKRLP